MTDDLDSLRSEIDALDREIVGLLNRRARLGWRQAGRRSATVGRSPTRIANERSSSV